MKQSGVVLTMVLFFLLAVMLALIEGWQVVTLQWRINHNRYRQLQLWQAAEIGLQQADNELNTVRTVSCQLPWQSRVDLLSHDSDWWHSQICCHSQVDGIIIDYYLSPLQQDPCARFKGRAAYYWQLTARAENIQQNDRVLQATVVVPILSRQVCQGNQHVLYHHWQSWRQI